MLWDRIVRAITFRRDVYAEVEEDQSFTSTAWTIVVVVAIIAALGNLRFTRFGTSLLGVLVGAILDVVGFAIGALVINVVGRAVYKADVTFEELVRALGLAYVWNAVGFLRILGPILSCILAPVSIIAWLALVVSFFVAAKEALDLDWVPTIVTVVLGWIVIVAVSFVSSLILGAMGLVASGILGAFGGG
jgi:hypothetical protein